MEFNVEVDDIVTKLSDAGNEDHVKEILINALYEQGETYTDLVIESDKKVNEALLENIKLQTILDTLCTMLQCDEIELANAVGNLKALAPVPVP